VILASESTRLRLVYWPCLGIWPLVLALVLALPVGLWVRQDAPFPSSVQCTRAFQAPVRDAKRVDASCSALDANAVRGWTSLPCSALPAALFALLEPASLLHRARVYAIENDSGQRSQVTPFSAGNRSGELDLATARELLLECAEGPARIGTPSSLQVMILDRNYEGSALVVALFVVVALLASGRRRVTLGFDASSGLLLVVERGFLRERHTLLIVASEVSDVVVTTGAAGILTGRRVELVFLDGRRAPLAESYIPLTFSVHEQIARRLRTYLQGLRSLRRRTLPA